MASGFSCASFVLPSMSVKRNVTLPDGKFGINHSFALSAHRYKISFPNLLICMARYYKRNSPVTRTGLFGFNTVLCLSLGSYYWQPEIFDNTNHQGDDGEERE